MPPHQNTRSKATKIAKAQALLVSQQSERRRLATEVNFVFFYVMGNVINLRALIHWPLFELQTPLKSLMDTYAVNRVRAAVTASRHVLMERLPHWQGGPNEVITPSFQLFLPLLQRLQNADLFATPVLLMRAFLENRQILTQYYHNPRADRTAVLIAARVNDADGIATLRTIIPAYYVPRNLIVDFLQFLTHHFFISPLSTRLFPNSVLFPFSRQPIEDAPRSQTLSDLNLANRSLSRRLVKLRFATSIIRVTTLAYSVMQLTQLVTSVQMLSTETDVVAIRESEHLWPEREDQAYEHMLNTGTSFSLFVAAEFLLRNGLSAYHWFTLKRELQRQKVLLETLIKPVLLRKNHWNMHKGYALDTSFFELVIDHSPDNISASKLLGLLQQALLEHGIQAISTSKTSITLAADVNLRKIAAVKTRFDELVARQVALAELKKPFKENVRTCFNPLNVNTFGDFDENDLPTLQTIVTLSYASSNAHSIHTIAQKLYPQHRVYLNDDKTLLCIEGFRPAHTKSQMFKTQQLQLKKLLAKPKLPISRTPPQPAATDDAAGALHEDETSDEHDADSPEKKPLKRSKRPSPPVPVQRQVATKLAIQWQNGKFFKQGDKANEIAPLTAPYLPKFRLFAYVDFQVSDFGRPKSKAVQKQYERFRKKTLEGNIVKDKGSSGLKKSKRWVRPPGSKTWRRARYKTKLLGSLDGKVRAYLVEAGRTKVDGIERQLLRACVVDLNGGPGH